MVISAYSHNTSLMISLTRCVEMKITIDWTPCRWHQ